MRPYGEEFNTKGTRTSKPRRRNSPVRANVRRRVKKKERARPVEADGNEMAKGGGG